MLLLKDYHTGKKSLTVTCFVISFLFSVITEVILLYKLLNSKVGIGDIAYGFYSLSFTGIFVSLYWNKRVRFSKDGLEISNDLTSEGKASNGVSPSLNQ